MNNRHPQNLKNNPLLALVSSLVAGTIALSASVIPFSSGLAQTASIGSSLEVKLDVNRFIEPAVSWLDKKFRDSNKYRSKSDTWLFFEGNHCSQNIVGSLWSKRNGQEGTSVKSKPWFKNDEARSVLIQNAQQGDILFVADSSNGSEKDDVTQIEVKKSIPGNYCITTFEVNYEDDFVLIKHKRKNNLDGKISYVRNY